MHKRREGVRACNFDLFGNTQNLPRVLKIECYSSNGSISKDALRLCTCLAKPYEWQEVLYIVTRGRFCCSYSDYRELHGLPPSLRLCALVYMYNLVPMQALPLQRAWYEACTCTMSVSGPSLQRESSDSLIAIHIYSSGAIFGGSVWLIVN